jgi:hypothetical protein
MNRSWTCADVHEFIISFVICSTLLQPGTHTQMEMEKNLTSQLVSNDRVQMSLIVYISAAFYLVIKTTVKRIKF